MKLLNLFRRRRHEHEMDDEMRFHIDMDRLIALSANAMHVAMHIDAEVGVKFRLKKQRHDIWRKVGRKRR